MAKLLPVIEGDEECSPIAVAYSWDFGDSLGSGDRRPVHQYATSGNYDVEVEISYRCGNTFVLQLLLPEQLQIMDSKRFQLIFFRRNNNRLFTGQSGGVTSRGFNLSI